MKKRHRSTPFNFGTHQRGYIEEMLQAFSLKILALDNGSDKLFSATLVTNQPTRRNNFEERISQLHRAENLKFHFKIYKIQCER
jgi:hypothetical protein